MFAKLTGYFTSKMQGILNKLNNFQRNNFKFDSSSEKTSLFLHFDLLPPRAGLKLCLGHF